MTALQHMGDPVEVGAAAVFLASSDSSFMTASEVARRRRLGATLTQVRFHDRRRYNERKKSMKKLEGKIAVITARKQRYRVGHGEALR